MLSKLIREELLQNEKAFVPHQDTKVLIKNEEGEDVSLDLSVLDIDSVNADALLLFSNITTAKELIKAYKKGRSSLPFEEENEVFMKGRSEYAKKYLDKIIKTAENLKDEDAALISEFVKNLDIYTAVRSCETLFSNRANLQLLKLAQTKKNWTVLFDHLAIRTGSSNKESAQQIVQMLIKYHGYKPPSNKDEYFYRFKDGRSAYILYKLLNNAQVLRLFVDQSDDKKQIIQHWNYVYGYTAHHLGLRIVELKDGVLRSVGLTEISKEMQKRDVIVMQATGLYTKGLLEQAFTKPQKDESIPQEVLKHVDKELIESIKNAKLLEIVARKEMPVYLAEKLYKHYQLKYQKQNPLFSAPYYNYFLPAQAAHVIKTSM